MGIFDKLFGTNQPNKNEIVPINTYADFWNWFEQNEKTFFTVLKNNGDVNSIFFEKLGPKLDELKDGFWFLAGMANDTTAELILTADGVIKNMVFVEELVEAAPKLNTWKITALKPPTNTGEWAIKMEDFVFDNTKMNFYSTHHDSMPDEIDITITHKDYNDENKQAIITGTYLALDNFLGELNAITSIDNVNIINPKDATQELIPFEKLKAFLSWREKEFVEKYKGLKHNTESGNYSGLEATLSSGLPLIAIINTDLLHWDSKASHPWIAVMDIKFDGQSTNGMPNESTYQLLDKIEDHIMAELKDVDGYLNIGRQTAESVRNIYFACVDFRKPSKVLNQIKHTYQNEIELDFDIYKDKYWTSFNRFMPS